MPALQSFDRRFLHGGAGFTQVGRGALGGKAAGLALVEAEILPAISQDLRRRNALSVPVLTVLGTDVFDSFMWRNHLIDLPFRELSDSQIAHLFQQGELPAEFLGDLMSLVDDLHVPLAVRSSALLEDTLTHPFAGIYATKLIANNHNESDERFHRLLEAIKFVYASTFFESARSYRRSAGVPEGIEKMAVIVQEVVGQRHGSLFYPDISGVARSYNYYPVSPSRPEDGMAGLAMGLGKTIVDGDACWTFSPRRPAAPPPVDSPHAQLHKTQTEFWAINMSAVAYDPVRETEYLAYCPVADAGQERSLNYLASTYDAESDRLYPGVSRKGPRVLDFAPLLAHDTLPLNDCIKAMLAASRERLGAEVEIEFAVTLVHEPQPSLRVGFLQVRPMPGAESSPSVDADEWTEERALVASDSSLGNGTAVLRDVVYVRPDSFFPSHTVAIARELGAINRSLVSSGTPYALIGFGRWGSSDPWLGIPVEWGQISGAKVIVEATTAGMRPELSQGSHFFHNLISRQVFYLSVPPDGEPGVDWKWLDSQDTVEETGQVRHVRTRTPLEVRVDGRTRRGVILKDG